MALDESHLSSDREAATVADAFPTRHLPRPEVRAMPDAPRNQWRLIGPGIIAAGVGLASGEFILYPYIASSSSTRTSPRRWAWSSSGPRWSAS
jgi:hypothetical protein